MGRTEERKKEGDGQWGIELGNLCTKLVGEEDREVAGRSPATPIKAWPFLLHALAVGYPLR
jgi:hypothetical protein